MVFQPVPNVIKVAIEGRMDTQDVVNSVYAQKITPGPISPQNVLDITNLVALVWFEDVLPTLGSQYVYNRSVGTDLTAQDGAQSITSLSAGVTGGITNGTPDPNNVAFCITLNSGQAGRSQRGRLFMPGIRSIMRVGPNELTLVAANAMAEGVSNLLGSIFSGTENTFQAVIVSRYTNNALRPAGVATRIAGVGYRNLVLDSQRRRLPGRGT